MKRSKPSKPPSRPETERKRGRSAPFIAAAALAAALAIGVVIWTQHAPVPPAPAEPQAAVAIAPESVPPRFVGAERCGSCHAAEYATWNGSQHQRAMEPADEHTVLGDFNDGVFDYQGVRSRFFRRDGRYVVRTDGPDGKPADFEVKYTFGVYPLQQYLVEFPDGRLQALALTWDARPREQGGQRWFRQYPDEKIDHRDELHWTRHNQNWNFMCADCHSTDVRKNYNAAGNSFATEWSEINVGCEACHGPGSAHIDWAAERSAAMPSKGLTVSLDARRGAAWSIDPATGNAKRNRERPHDAEAEVCAQCHARRGQIAERYFAGRRFLDHYRPALLTAPLYHADGQQRDEVYIWGSFLQSRMHAQGVTCSDCHEPHSQKLRAEGNAVCAQCHAPAKYDAETHTGHRAGATGSRCVDCHMPPTTYMVIDPRRDHGFRVPRPDLTPATGAPNACNGCHADRDAAWADLQIQRLHGQRGEGLQRYAPAFAAAERGTPEAAALAAIAADSGQPAIARATAVSLLAGAQSPEALAEIGRAAKSSDPLLRFGAATTLDSLPAEPRLAIGAPLLADPLRAIRLEAAGALAALPDAALAPYRDAFDRAAAEFEAAQRYNADRPEARTALGTYYGNRGRTQDAEAELRAAIRLHPGYVPAYANLADLQRALGDDAGSEAVLREGLRAAPGDASLHFALGLALVRQKQGDAALRELRTAAKLAPANTRFAYVYAVALADAGRRGDALHEIDRALAQRPGDRDLLMAAAQFARDGGQMAAMQRYLRALTEHHGSDPQVRAWVRSMSTP